jgi:hypothetical protein
LNCHTAGFQAVAFRSNSNRPGLEQGTNGNAIDATLKGEVCIVDGICLATVVTAAPNRRASAFKIHTLPNRRTTFAPGVHRFNVNQRDVRTVRL